MMDRFGWNISVRLAHNVELGPADGEVGLGGARRARG